MSPNNEGSLPLFLKGMKSDPRDFNSLDSTDILYVMYFYLPTAQTNVLLTAHCSFS